MVGAEARVEHRGLEEILIRLFHAIQVGGNRRKHGLSLGTLISYHFLALVLQEGARERAHHNYGTQNHSDMSNPQVDKKIRILCHCQTECFGDADMIATRLSAQRA